MIDDLSMRFLAVERHHIATKGGFLKKVESVAFGGVLTLDEARVTVKDLLFDALDDKSDAALLAGVSLTCLLAYVATEEDETLSWIEGRVNTQDKLVDDDDIDGQLAKLISDFEQPMGEGSVNAIDMELGEAAFADYDCEAAVRCGVLLLRPMRADAASGSQWHECTAPESQAFLDRVNAHFATNYRMEQFV